MGRLLNIVTPLHKATKRDYLARMTDDKVHCMMKAQGVRGRLLGRRPPLRLWRLPVHRGPLEARGAGADRHLRAEATAPRSSTSAAARRSCSTRSRSSCPSRRSSASTSPSTASPSAKDEIKPVPVPLPGRRTAIRSATSSSISSSRSARCTICASSSCETALRRDRARRQEQVHHGRELPQRARAVQPAVLGADRRSRSSTPSEWIWLYKHFGYTGDYEFIYFE